MNGGDFPEPTRLVEEVDFWKVYEVRGRRFLKKDPLIRRNPAVHLSQRPQSSHCNLASGLTPLRRRRRTRASSAKAISPG